MDCKKGASASGAQQKTSPSLVAGVVLLAFVAISIVCFSLYIGVDYAYEVRGIVSLGALPVVLIGLVLLTPSGHPRRIALAVLFTFLIIAEPLAGAWWWRWNCFGGPERCFLVDSYAELHSLLADKYPNMRFFDLPDYTTGSKTKYVLAFDGYRYDRKNERYSIEFSSGESEEPGCDSAEPLLYSLVVKCDNLNGEGIHVQWFSPERTFNYQGVEIGESRSERAFAGEYNNRHSTHKPDAEVSLKLVGYHFQFVYAGFRYYIKSVCIISSSDSDSEAEAREMKCRDEALKILRSR